MIAAPIPPNEAQRLAALHRLKILDTPPSEAFDRITRIATRLFGVRISALTLIDDTRQWFKSSVGLAQRETPRNVSFCGHVVAGDGPLEVCDAKEDARFSDNPFVLGEPGIRFYFGYPVCAVDGSKVGALCLIDQVPRHMSAEDRSVLADLAGMAETELNVAIMGEAYDQLAVVERRYSELFNSSEVLVISLDAAGKITEANPSWRAHFGYSLPYGLEFSQCVREDWRRSWEELRLGLQKNRDVAGFEGWFRSREGRELYLVGNMTCLQQASSPKQLHVILRDTTVLWRAGDEHRANAELAAQESEDRAAILAQVSHEVRTPLNGLLGVSRMLLDADLKPEQLRLVETMHRGAADMRFLLDHVLEFSKAESGHMELESIAFSPRDVVRSTAALFEPVAMEKGLSIVTDLDGSVPRRVKGDPHRLGQVLNNLVGNALKFTEHGKVLVGLRCASEEGWLEFRVEDEGVGIAPEDICKLFQKFGQGRASVERKFGGTGLGLSICKQIVELMGGRIWVESREGEGATFLFGLPLEAAGAELLDLETPSAGRVGHGEHVLVVDDSGVNRMVATHALIKLGYEVQEAAGGEEALACWRSGWPDAILMDCEMPGVDGLQATREIRAAEHRSAHIPIIAVTGHVLDEERRRCKAAGMDACLRKPFELDELGRILVEWTGGKPVDESAFGEFIDQAEAIGGEGMYHELLSALELDLSIGLENLDAAVKAGDADGTRKAAHKIAGSAGEFAANRVCQSARSMEEQARGGILPEQSACQNLHAEVSRLLAFLHDRVTCQTNGASSGKFGVANER